MDLDVKYPRATPEKALLDWLYLGASRYSKISGPPLDLELERLSASRLRRLARTMGLTEELADAKKELRCRSGRQGQQLDGFGDVTTGTREANRRIVRGRLISCWLTVTGKSAAFFSARA